jgi:hypothetical protein
MIFISITNCTYHIKNIPKNKGECSTIFKFSFFDLGVKLRDDKIQKRIFTSMNFISITNLQTTSKTWAKTRGNAAQILDFAFLSLEWKWETTKNKTYFTSLWTWFQLHTYSHIFHTYKNISKTRLNAAQIFDFQFMTLEWKWETTKIQKRIFTFLSISFQLQMYKPHQKHEQKQGGMLHNFEFYHFSSLT